MILGGASADFPERFWPGVTPRLKRGLTWFTMRAQHKSCTILSIETGMRLEVLNSGSCETLKASVHSAALGLAIVMGLYNAAAWFRRRQPHLAVNAVFYVALVLWEQQHVAHHLAKLRACEPQRKRPADTPKPKTAAA